MKKKVRSIFFLFFILVTSSAWALPLPAPSLISPANGYTAVNLNPIAFSWSSVSGSTRYDIQVSTSMFFSTIFLSASPTVTSYSFMGWSNNVTYYWRVRAYNVTTGNGYWSSTRNFVIRVPVDCVLSVWSAWTFYSQTACWCNAYELTEKRTRTITTQPQNGGLACGVLIEYRTTQQTCDSGVILNGGYCAESWPVFPFRFNGAGDCRQELPTVLYPGLNLVIDSSPCFGNDTAWYDNYYAGFLWSCDNSHVENCINGDWQQCGYSGYVEVPGYTCWQGGTSVCEPGVYFQSCADIKARGIASLPDVRSSVNRFPVMDYLGIKIYSNGSVEEGYKIWGEQGCSDVINLKRENDEVSVSNYNDETYSFESVFHNDLPVVLGPVSKYINITGTYVFDGILNSPFGRDDIIQSFYGPFMFDGNISNTNCSFIDYRFVSDPSFWWECSLGKNEGDTCSYTYQGVEETYTCGPSEYNENYFGMEAYSYDYAYYGGAYDLWQVWRYPVDNNFVPSGPIELVIDNGAGYVSSLGGADPNDLVTESGYVYRFYSTMADIASSYDFNSFPCSQTGSGGSGTYRKSRISKQKITDHAVGGAYERRN